MKLAVTVKSDNLDAEIDPRFGRCQTFLIVDTETMEYKAVSNASASASGGAGIAAGQTVIDEGVQVVLTGNVGPKAYQVLAKAGIHIFPGVSGKALNAIEEYKKGSMQATSEPTVEEHAGMKPPV